MQKLQVEICFPNQLGGLLFRVVLDEEVRFFRDKERIK